MAPSYALAFKKNRAAPSSLPPSARPPRTARESERTGFPSNANGRDVEPLSFEYAQRSKEGAKNDAPPHLTFNSTADRMGQIPPAGEVKTTRYWAQRRDPSSSAIPVPDSR